jgi:hypothetical protein
MDRNDEAKDVDDVLDDAGMPIDDASSEPDVPTRGGDILGLGDFVPPKSPDDPVTEFDDESVARRRARVNEGELDGGSELPRTKGATGIDMGSGGTGTDFE